MVKDVIQIDHQTKLEPILSYFKKGQTHIGIVSEVVQEDGKDPEFRKVGIITLEDIIGEILQHDDNNDSDANEIRGERGRVKEKLVLLFSDQEKGKELGEAAINAIAEYLQR